ncbi:MAG: hypothetical protein ACI80S_000281, partial [Pseudohongiellaceae bacterium]
TKRPLAPLVILRWLKEFVKKAIVIVCLFGVVVTFLNADTFSTLVSRQ